MKPCSRSPLYLIVLLLSGPGSMLRGQHLQIAWPAVDEYLQLMMVEAGIPAAALAVVEGDRIVYAKGFGKTGPAGQAVSDRTPFMLGSTGKSITAISVMQLVEDGMLSLDTPVTAYLPWFRLSDPESSANITIRQLLNHTSGISSISGLQQMSDDDTSGYAIEKQVRKLSDTVPGAAPGSRFQYSNSNFIILGMVIQAVTGISYEEYVQQRIFEPLEMQHCFTDRRKAERSGLATAHRKWLGRSKPADNLPFVRGAVSAGYQMCSVRDMAHYVIAQLNGGKYRQWSVLSESGMAEMHRPSVEAPGRGHYAMGWTVSNWDDIPIVSHGGAAPGYLSDIILVPGRQLGVVLLMNTYTPLFSQQQMMIADNITRTLLGLTPVETKNDWISLTIIAVLVLILLLQTFSLVRTLMLTKRWRSLPANRKPGLLRRMRFLYLPTIWNLGWAAGVLLVIPGWFNLHWPVILLFQPDAGWMAIASGSLAAAWGLVRPAIIIRQEFSPGAHLPPLGIGKEGRDSSRREGRTGTSVYDNIRI